MNTPLMIAVEEIVRPIHAPLTKIIRMREELYCHLEAIYNEELVKLDDEEAALQSAINRLGDSDTIRAELRTSIPRWNQILCKYFQYILRQPGEHRVRYAVRFGLVYALLLAVLLLVPVVITSALSGKGQQHPGASFFVLLAFVMGWNSFVAILCAQPLIERKDITRHLRKFGFAGAYFGISVTVTHFLLWVVSGWQDSVTILLPWAPLFVFCASWSIFSIVLWHLNTELKQTREWDVLELAC
jgi:hypothetical protein